MTPSFIGLIATTLPGVRPSISFASRPTATTSPVFLLMATIDGSFTTMPLPPEKTSVFAVPKSIARSEENKLNTDLRLNPFLFMTLSPPAEKASPPNRLGAPDDLHDMPVKLRALNLQRHLLGLALRHERELGCIAGIAGALLLVHCDDVPEIIAGLEPGDIDARPRNPLLLHCFREHRRGAYPQYIGNRLGDRFPFKMHCGLFRILHDERLQI